MKPIISDSNYKDWILHLKQKFQHSQIMATVQVNQELLKFYWELGAEIVEKQANTNWGSKFILQLSSDMQNEFPEVKGFSFRNINYIRQWYLFYNQKDAIVQQVVAQLQQPLSNHLLQIPWGHHIAIISKCKTVPEAIFYISKIISNGWSRAVLVHQIESGLYHRDGRSVSNFKQTLPAVQSDLAQQTLKDPYVFDFLMLSSQFNERELEKGLIDHITKFLMELGAGFAYIGNQVPIQVGDRDFVLDLLFYQTRLHCYVVVELKITEFEPEHVGKLNFYIKAVDEQYKQNGDEPTIGLLLCKSKDKLVAEYALSDINKPMGISEYQLTQILPEKFKASLPTVETIEAEFSKIESSFKKN